jgi:hypothetical protein
MVLDPSFTVALIDHKFLVSGHSYLSCDQDFGVIEKNKVYFREIYVPSDWEQVIATARKVNPFRVVKMTGKDFVSTKELENLITNRKKAEDGSKVEWLKMQWIRIMAATPLVIHYKYTNNPEPLFAEVNIAKRKYTTDMQPKDLQLLFVNGRSIENVKYTDLQELKNFIPPIHHEFYDNLKTNVVARDIVFPDIEEDEDDVA